MKRLREALRHAAYVARGRVPWSPGYLEHRGRVIVRTLRDPNVLDAMRRSVALPPSLAVGLDERAVEYAWLAGQMPAHVDSLLDAGSTLNHTFLKGTPLSRRPMTIVTLGPEGTPLASDGVSYLYADLRELPLRDGLFDVIVCQSTLEHIGMNNTMYGHADERRGRTEPTYEYLRAIVELVRVLRHEGRLLITVPFGQFEEHDFFQQFDERMLRAMIDSLETHCVVSAPQLFAYSRRGWQRSSLEGARDARSFNPHTGRGRGNDGAAHSRAIACLSARKR